MAMIDYGAIAFKNGNLISTEMFTPMIDMVGWEDTEKDTYHDYHTDEDKPLELNENYFAYVGDKDCTLAFYKEQMVVVQRWKDGTFSYNHEFFNCTNYIWSKWEDYAGVGNGEFPKVKVTKRNGYLVCKWKYRGNKYKVYFGFGVDLAYYKKRGIVNYYRSPEYIVKSQIPRWFKDKIYELKELF
jgi:hypothetical protein